MDLQAIVREPLVRAAIKALDAAWRMEATPFHCRIKYQGGSVPAEPQWRPDLKQWAYLDSDETPGRHWFCFGSERPRDGMQLRISLEVNPPWAGRNLRCAGIVAQSTDQTFICHTGKVGGGRQGVGKTAFVRWMEENKPHYPAHEVRWADGRTERAFEVCRLGSGREAAKTADFVKIAEQFKGL